MLIKRGLSFDDAKERIANLVKEQARVRDVMKEDNKSNTEIKKKQQEMIEELWKY